ncbi:hypothetical protein BX616_010496 [Lobosporangium transversale]|uniref:Uncharacterized protein n=1 Tax=Lobosporangium transversale TaxID=64571 RepID=A0A1Y2GV60_9FUNG|nr:hypothetical protein BCR41DRAFT_394656 [Lobosporangium transversale]KAF9919244.1 hypothetical protein BX616_010496 [Lobosporangium transversale]ORZ21898.1 hypothetical protein BCR41DRAFT_394656 [Lobosporangium transversale]|eukprot:XP_021883149.1 hypothetical protein BCR41DRAFT_394656 [Lobosporangium transversale]
MLDWPFSDVCSTVSCWALLFSVILPSMQGLGTEVTARTLFASHLSSSLLHVNTQQPQGQHHHIQQQHLHYHSQHHQDYSSLQSQQMFSLTFYLRTNSNEMISLSLLANLFVPLLSTRERWLLHSAIIEDQAASYIDHQQRQDKQTKQKQQKQKPEKRGMSGGAYEPISKDVKKLVLEFETTAGQRVESPKTIDLHDPTFVPYHKEQAPIVVENTHVEEERVRFNASMSHVDADDDPFAHEAIQLIPTVNEKGKDPWQTESLFRLLSPSLSSLLSLSLIALIKDNKKELVTIIQKYWGELNVLYRIQMQSEEQLSDKIIGHGYLEQKIQTGAVEGVRKGRITIYKRHKNSNGEASTSIEYNHGDSDLQPLVRFHLPTSMPTMSRQWIALTPCAPRKTFDHTVLHLAASAILFYPTLGVSCKDEPIASQDHSASLFTLDHDAAE